MKRKVDKWQAALNVARRASNRLTLRGSAIEIFTPIEPELKVVENMTGSMVAASLVSLAALGFKTLNVLRDPSDPLAQVMAQGRAELRLSQLIQELGPEQIWQVLREWTYGELEMPETDRLEGDIAHAAAAAVRRLDDAP